MVQALIYFLMKEVMGENKLILLLVGLLVLAGIVGGSLFLKEKPAVTNTTSQNLTQTSEDKNLSEYPPVENPAEVLEYKKKAYDDALSSGKLVVLYFYANWCPICREEFPKMQLAFKRLPADKVVGIRVNFNDSETDKDEEALAEEFDIPYQHSKVFLKNGDVILKTLDSWQESDYLKEINSALDEG